MKLPAAPTESLHSSGQGPSTFFSLGFFPVKMLSQTENYYKKVHHDHKGN